MKKKIQLRVNKEVIPHDEQRYDTVGDWWIEDGVIEIRISELGNADWEWFIGMHEEIEAYFCLKDGITEKEVTDFDIKFEKMRKDYPDLVGEMEPGDHDKAPYHKQHAIASRIEKWLFDQMFGEQSDIEWAKFGDKINSL